MVSTKFHTLSKRHWISWSFWKKNFGTVANSLHSPKKKRKMVWKEASQACLSKEIQSPSTFQHKKSSHPSHPHPHLLHTSLQFFHDFPPTSEPPRSKMSKATPPLATPRSSARQPGRGADLIPPCQKAVFNGRNHRDFFLATKNGKLFDHLELCEV